MPPEQEPPCYDSFDTCMSKGLLDAQETVERYRSRRRRRGLAILAVLILLLGGGGFLLVRMQGAAREERQAVARCEQAVKRLNDAWETANRMMDDVYAAYASAGDEGYDYAALGELMGVELESPSMPVCGTDPEAGERAADELAGPLEEFADRASAVLHPAAGSSSSSRSVCRRNRFSGRKTAT